MEQTLIKQKTFGEMKNELVKTLQGFQEQLAEKKALHHELSLKALRITDCAYNIEVYAEYTNIGIEKYQLEREMEILDFQIESVELCIAKTNEIIEAENLIKKQDEEIAKMAELSAQQLAKIEQLEKEGK